MSSTFQYGLPFGSWLGAAALSSLPFSNRSIHARSWPTSNAIQTSSALTSCQSLNQGNVHGNSVQTQVSRPPTVVTSASGGKLDSSLQPAGLTLAAVACGGFGNGCPLLLKNLGSEAAGKALSDSSRQ